jgi:beta-ureidopropionase / N-carbamoyl-L-amino-acid hydrolase
MNARADTLLAAAHMIVAVNATARTIPGALASVAVITSSPQSINTLAGRVQFSIDARARDDATLAKLEAALHQACTAVTESTGVAIEKWDRFWNSPETVFNETAVGAVRASVEDAGFGYSELQSGAGHDS